MKAENAASRIRRRRSATSPGSCSRLLEVAFFADIASRNWYLWEPATNNLYGTSWYRIKWNVGSLCRGLTWPPGSVVTCQRSEAGIITALDWVPYSTISSKYG